MNVYAPAPLGGALSFTPGAPPPVGLQSTRQDWAARLGFGLPLAHLPGLMGQLFNLCGHAHRACCCLAIGAAAPGLLPPPPDVAEGLRRETALEHLRRIGLDWPRLLADGPAAQAATAGALAALRQAPLSLQGMADPWPPLRDWLRHALLHMPVADWLVAWQAGGPDWLQHWGHQHGDQWLPALVAGARDRAEAFAPLLPAGALRPHRSAHDLCMLGATLAHEPEFTLRPHWHGQCAHTGPWTRLGAVADDAPLPVWALLGSRLAELARLALAGGQDGLRWGALATGPRRGLAWVEMARGLLVHQVEVDPASHSVLACRVLAPTEWNFHPQGEVARRLARLDPGLPGATLTRQVNLLVAAFDPCLPFHIRHLAAPTRVPPTEAHHA
jgi:hypothetical protein